MEFYHVPVLLNEVLEGLKIKQDGVYLDCTLGGGGHSWHILEKSKPDGKLLAIDQDEQAIKAAAIKLEEFSGRWQLFNTNFINLKQVVNKNGEHFVDGVLLDLGVSSYQLDNGERGFSYMHDAPLDMRMDINASVTAEQLVNSLSQTELEIIIRDYGEERWARRISQFIVDQRERENIRTTGKLVEVIKKAIPAGARREGPHPAKRTFQALRIAVNNELGLLEDALKDAVSVLRPGGRICVITFHSLEDRIVKDTFKSMTVDCICPPKMPVCCCNAKKIINLVNKKPIIPGSEELNDNPRSRSAKLRIAEKI